MYIPIDVRVRCADGDAGKSTCVVINPITKAITHIVVFDHQLLGMERLVPIKFVAETTPETITLTCTREELKRQPAFIGFDYHFMGDEEAHWPLVVPSEYLGVEASLVFEKFKQVPPGEPAVRRGAAVRATDGIVGYVEEFMADPKTGHVTHLVLSRGHLWGKQTVTIPIGRIRNISEHEVSLSVYKQTIGELPAIPLQRS